MSRAHLCPRKGSHFPASLAAWWGCVIHSATRLKGKLCLPGAVIPKRSSVILAFLSSFMNWGAYRFRTEHLHTNRASIGLTLRCHVKTVYLESNLVHNILDATEKYMSLICSPHAWKYFATTAQFRLFWLPYIPPQNSLFDFQTSLVCD